MAAPACRWRGAAGRWSPTSRSRPAPVAPRSSAAGRPGLSTARQLQRRGYDVTIYAATVPPDTTSNMSWAGYTPTTALILPERRTPAWDAQFRTAAEVSYPPAAD